MFEISYRKHGKNHSTIFVKKHDQSICGGLFKAPTWYDITSTTGTKCTALKSNSQDFDENDQSESSFFDTALYFDMCSKR